VLLEFFVQVDDTLAFLLRADQEEPRLERVALGRDAVLDWTTKLLSMITVGDGALRNHQTPFQPLLEVVEQESAPDDVVCIVPHGPLHLIPFHALETSVGPLIRRNPVVYAPSASVLASITARNGGDDNHGAIVVGDTRGDLPYARLEAEMVSRLLAVEAVPGREATRRRLMEAIAAARDLRILHLACHGTFDVDEPLASGILTAAGDDGNQSSVLSARDLLDIEMTADLVALSACDSGISERRPGDELVGLTRALLVAGARSVLASLWKVNDLSTSVLMRVFYDGWLRDGLPKAQALQLAQCRVMDMTAAELEASDEAQQAMNRDLSRKSATSPATRFERNARIFAHPRHWAPFTLVGDWT
jgi:CHAT domain-containing protein